MMAKEMIWDLWISCDEWWLYVALLWYVFTYHEFFSKESWLMEFMEWDWWLLNAYKEMSYLTAQDKIIYFNTNSKLPNEMP